MSSIYFQSSTRRATLHGSERAYFDIFGKTLLAHSLELDDFSSNHPLSCFLPQWVRTPEDARRCLGGFSLQEIKGHSVHSLKANTMIAVGSDFVRLAALIDGACENHGFFEKTDLPQISQAIKAGISTGFFRSPKTQGWNDILDLFTTSNSEIVMSFSVCSGFPQSLLSQSEYKEEIEITWDDAIQRLRTKRPALNLSQTFFGSGLNGYSLMKELRQSLV